MARFQCLLCGGEFGCISSHYCLEHGFVLVTVDKGQELFVELIDWEYELITNNEYLKAGYEKSLSKDC